MEDRATPEVGKRRKGIMRPPRPHMTHFELPGNLFSDLSLPTPAPENLTEEKETLSVKVYRSSVLLSPFRCSQVLHEHSMFRREVTKGTCCLRQCASVIKQSSWVRVTNKHLSKQERLS